MRNGNGHDGSTGARPRRSALYVPGANARALEKSRSSDADVLILDLEDSVAPPAKAEARAAVARALRDGGFGHREVVVRVNALGTDWGRDDLLAAAASGAAALLLPKVATSGDVMFAAAVLAKADAPERVRLWAMVETPAAVLNMTALARTAADPASRLDAFVMGTNDLAKDARARLRPGRAAMAAWLSFCVAAARSEDCDILDGVYNRLDDPEGLRAECEQGRDFGMDGKTCIHPGQIEACNAAFSPAGDELAWARTVVAAFEGAAATTGVLRLEGRMVERLHVVEARRTLAMADTIAARKEQAAGSF